MTIKSSDNQPIDDEHTQQLLALQVVDPAALQIPDTSVAHFQKHGKLMSEVRSLVGQLKAGWYRIEDGAAKAWPGSHRGKEVGHVHRL